MTAFWHRFGQRYPQARTVLVMIPLVVLLIAANNERVASQRARTDAQFSYAINASACGFIITADEAIQRSLKALSDPEATPGAKARNRQALLDAERFKHRQVKIPARFNCANLPKDAP